MGYPTVQEICSEDSQHCRVVFTLCPECNFEFEQPQEERCPKCNFNVGAAFEVERQNEIGLSFKVSDT